MRIHNIKNRQADSGFTIVELLVVIVVIGILAAITIVSYAGITSRANKSSAQAAANSIQKKAEVYNTDGPTNNFPVLLADLTGASSTATYYVSPSSISLKPALLAVDNLPAKPSEINFFTCGHKGTVAPPLTVGAITVRTGDRIGYWDYQNPGVLYYDNGVVTDGFVSTFEVACFITAS